MNREQMYQYLVIGIDNAFFVKSHSKSNNKYKQEKIIKMLDFFYRQHICPVWWTVESTNDWYSNGYELCYTTRRFVSTRL